jgi:hypothetical protein
MVRQIKGTFGALTLLASVLVAVVLVPASPAAAACAVGTEANSQYGTFTASIVNIRTGPSTSCAVVAQGRSGDWVRFDCWDYGTSVTRDGLTYTTWSHIMDESLSTSGWTSDAYLTGAGATYQCLSTSIASNLVAPGAKPVP